MNHTNGDLKALFEATKNEADPHLRARNADILMTEAVREEATRIYNGHAQMRKEQHQRSLATGTEIKEILATQRLLRLAEDGPVSFGRAETERLELCARILCTFKGLDYERLNEATAHVPDHEAAIDPRGFCKELAKTRHKPTTPGPA